jgi:hypothetical protein
MRNSRRMWLAVGLSGLLILLGGTFAVSTIAAQQTPNSAQIPVVKGGAGPCSADFTVHDATGKGIYNAKISIQLKYGFMGLRNLDLTVGTNYDGKARVEGMPGRIKGSAEFRISHGDQYRLVPYDPLSECNSKHQVVLGGK